MRILFVAFSGIPAHSAQSINVMRGCSAMADLGHEVTLLVPRQHPERLDGVEDIYSFYDLPRNFEVRYLPSPAFRGGRTLFTWSVALAAWQSKCDLVFARYLRSAILCARLGFNTIYDLHSPIKGKGASISQLARSGHLRLLVTNTEEMRKNIVGHRLPGLDPDIVFPIPTGRDPLRTAPEPASLPKHTTGLNLGFVGKMQVQKGMALIAELSQRLPGHDFHLIGGDEAQIREWREKMPGPHVHFHGYVPQAEVGRYICALDVCLLPNVPHHENPSGILYSSPMKALDYMAHGKAILASDLGEIREILTDEDALMLPPGDAAAWADAIEHLDQETISTLGAAAKARLAAQYSMRARYAQILEKAGFDKRVN
jgi:glycosyltransferase involved in cell wall biosynthesis